MKRKRKRKEYTNITVSDWHANGNPVGLSDTTQLLFFNPKKVVLGDVVHAYAVKNYSIGVKAKITAMIKRSPFRIVQSLCPHKGVCGGCIWQEIAYAQQLLWKRAIIQKCFDAYHIMLETPILSCIASEIQVNYRNKMEYSFSSQRWFTEYDDTIMDNDTIDKNTNALGFFAEGQKVVHINYCALQHIGNDIRNSIYRWAIDNKVSFYHRYNHTGWLRNCIVRNSHSDATSMVIIVVCYADETMLNALSAYIVLHHSCVSSIYTVINDKKNDMWLDMPITHAYGTQTIIEQINMVRYQYGPHSFFQVNSVQCAQLYALVIKYLQPHKNMNVFDLYCGVGSIALQIAPLVRHVLGIEYSSESVLYARENAQSNNCDNAYFLAGDMKDMFTTDLITQFEMPEVLIINPPRVGMHKTVIKNIHEWSRSGEIKRIIYVSCNPRSLAHDIMQLSEYTVETVQPIDMMPYTIHIETIAVLTYRDKE